MINLNLKINKDYLIYHTLQILRYKNIFSSKRYRKYIKNFQRYGEELNSKMFRLLIGVVCPYDFESKILFKESLKTYFDKLKKSQHFQKIYQQTENYLKFCQNQWNKNLAKTTQLISEITGIDFEKENKIFEVYLTHPSLKEGHSFFYLTNEINRNVIAFGHNEDWPNYFTVYMWHEILHFYWLKPKDENIAHVIVQFATDNELRIRLNGGKYPPFISHSWLKKLTRKIYPYWKKYLNKKLKVKNIFELEKYILRKNMIK